MSRWTKIIIHHSGTSDSNTMSWDNIKHYHTKIKGWDDIGYHFGGEIIEGTPQILVGRPLYKGGAHCIGYNHNALGFMICGDFSKPETIISLQALEIYAKFLAGLCVALDIPPCHILMHREADTNRDCPGEYFPDRELIAKVIDIIKNLD